MGNQQPISIKVKVMQYFKDLIKEISKEDILQYYNEENHTIEESSKYFGVSYGMFIRILKYYGIHKDKDKHVEQIKKSKAEKYGDENYNNRDKAKETCLEKYGVDNPFKDREKMVNSYLEKLGVDHPMHDEEIVERCISKHDYEEIHRKGAETYFIKTGYTNPSYNPESVKKNLQTRIANGVFDSPGESNLEKRFEKILLRKFGEVRTHFRDDRYARSTGYMFECDFYVPSEDLFIELNAHPSHGKHPFTGNESDKLLLEELKSNLTPWNSKVIETWTQRDVEKMEVARKNKLNYLVIYPKTSIFDNVSFNDSKYKELITYLIKKLNQTK